MTIALVNEGQQEGHTLYSVSLTNRHGLVVRLLNYGASVMAIALPTEQGLENIVVGLPYAQDYVAQRTYFGATVGRVAGRLPQLQWQIGERVVSLTDNDQGRHKHGGDEGLDRCFFDITACGAHFVEFATVDPSGHNGYPGNLRVTVRYTLGDDDSLAVAITGISDQVTLFNPTNHTYFALDGCGQAITQQNVMVAATAYQPLEQDLLARRGWLPVIGSVFDLRHPRRLADVLQSDDAQIRLVGGLNHAFLVDNEAPAAVVLTSMQAQRRVTMTTDAQAVILYSGNHFAHNGVAPAIPQYGGITVEAQTAPETSADWSDITLLPLTPRTRHITWQFEY